MTNCKRFNYTCHIAGALAASLFVLSCATAALSQEFVGEEITYSIRKMGIQAGEAKLVITGLVQDEGREYFLLTFTADGMNFYDQEKIYLDPQTRYPLRVERNLNIFGRKERISERYDTPGRVRIRKTVGVNTTEQILEKPGIIDNIYAFIYRYRQSRPEDWELMTIRLPTRDVVMEDKGKVKMGAAGRDYETVWLQSTPRKYSVWFDTGPQRLPLRIDGAAGFGNTLMVMTKHQPAKDAANVVEDQPADPVKSPDK